MINRLIEILFNEEKVLKELLCVLEKQHKMIIKKDVLSLLQLEMKQIQSEGI